MLEKVEITTSTREPAGSGAFAIVKKIKLNGRLYAAKQIDPGLLHYAKDTNLTVTFEDEL